MKWFFVIGFIILTGVDNIPVEVNVNQIVSIRIPRDTDKFLTKETRCILFMADGKFVAVKETCDTVHQYVGED